MRTYGSLDVPPPRFPRNKSRLNSLQRVVIQCQAAFGRNERIRRMKSKMNRGRCTEAMEDTRIGYRVRWEYRASLSYISWSAQGEHCRGKGSSTPESLSSWTSLAMRQINFVDFFLICSQPLSRARHQGAEVHRVGLLQDVVQVSGTDTKVRTVEQRRYGKEEVMGKELEKTSSKQRRDPGRGQIQMHCQAKEFTGLASERKLNFL